MPVKWQIVTSLSFFIPLLLFLLPPPPLSPVVHVPWSIFSWLLEESYIFSNDINSLQHTLTSGHEREREREREKGRRGVIMKDWSEIEREEKEVEREEEEAVVKKRDGIMSRWQWMMDCTHNSDQRVPEIQLHKGRYCQGWSKGCGEEFKIRQSTSGVQHVRKKKK